MINYFYKTKNPFIWSESNPGFNKTLPKYENKKYKLKFLKKKEKLMMIFLKKFFIIMDGESMMMEMLLNLSKEL